MKKSRFIFLVAFLAFGFVWFWVGARKDKSSSVSYEPDSEGAAHPAAAAGGLKKDRDPLRSTAAVQASAAAGAVSSAGALTGENEKPGASAIRALQAESVRPWVVRRSGAADTVRTLVQGLWTSGNSADSTTAAQNFVHDYAEPLFGVRAENLAVGKIETTDRTKIVYEQNVDGVPVYGATLTLFFENGGLSRVQSDLASGGPLQSASAVAANFSADQALSQLRETQKSAYALTDPSQTHMVLYPGSTSLVYAYQFSVRDPADGKTYRVIYDAESRAVIKKIPSQIQ